MKQNDLIARVVDAILDTDRLRSESDVATWIEHGLLPRLEQLGLCIVPKEPGIFEDENTVAKFEVAVEKYLSARSDVVYDMKTTMDKLQKENTTLWKLVHTNLCPRWYVQHASLYDENNKWENYCVATAGTQFDQCPNFIKKRLCWEQYDADQKK